MRQQMEAVKLEGDRDKAQLAAERERFAREREEYERKMRADSCAPCFCFVRFPPFTHR